MDADPTPSSRWTLPLGSILLGLLALPLMLVTPTSFVIGLAVATAGSIAGAAASLGDRPVAQRVVGAVGCLSFPAALAFLALPFVGQG